MKYIVARRTIARFTIAFGAMLGSAAIADIAGAADYGQMPSAPVDYNLPPSMPAEYGTPPIFDQGMVANTQTPVEFGSGWYLRGDLGFGINTRQEKVSGSDLSAGIVKEETSYQDFFQPGIGIGYRFNQSLRMDATFDALLYGSITNANVVSGGCPGRNVETTVNAMGAVTTSYTSTRIFNCVDSTKKSYDAPAAMINGYFDMGEFGRFVPYVGAGIGVARITWSEKSTRTCVAGVNQICDGALISGSHTYTLADDNDVNYRFAYSFTAGTAYRMSDNLLLDVSYRMIHAGQSSLDYSNVQFSEGFGNQQLRLGLRYELW